MTADQAPGAPAADPSTLDELTQRITALHQMPEEQLRKENARLSHEITQLAVMISALVTKAIHTHWPDRPLPESIDAVTQMLKLRREAVSVSVSVWSVLRTDSYTSPSYSRRHPILLRTAQNILIGCGRSDDLPTLTEYSERLESMQEQRQRAQTSLRVRVRVSQAEAATEAPPEESAARKKPASTPPRILPDIDGFDYKPDPLQAATAAEFVELLRQLHVWAGEPSLRELARRCQGHIAHTTFAAMLNKDHRLPSLRTVLLFVEALLGGETDDLRAWTAAWRHIRFSKRSCQQRTGPQLKLTGND